MNIIYKIHLQKKYARLATRHVPTTGHSTPLPLSQPSSLKKMNIFKCPSLVTFNRSKQPGEGTIALQKFIGFVELDNLSLFKDHDPVII